MKKLIKQEQNKVLAELCQKIVALKWSERLVKETPDEIKYLDLEKIKDEDTKKQIKEYKRALENVEINKRSIECDVFAYKVLEEFEEEITNLLND